MFVHSCERQAQGSIREVTVPNFKSGKPFSFNCNASNQKSPWTPDSLFEDRGITEFGNLRFVSVNLTSENFDAVLEAIEAWKEARYRVTVKFPRLNRRPMVGTHRHPTFLRLDTEDCYTLDGKTWVVTEKLKVEVATHFIDDDLVTVEQ